MRQCTGRAWNTTTHTGAVYSVALSLDQRRALSGATDNTVRLWDLQTGQCLYVLKGHTDNVNGVALGAGPLLIRPSTRALRDEAA